MFVRMLQAYLQLAVLLKYSASTAASCLLSSSPPYTPSDNFAVLLDSANKNNEKYRQIKFAQIIIYVYVICVCMRVYLYSFSRILFLYLHKMH